MAEDNTPKSTHPESPSELPETTQATPAAAPAPTSGDRAFVMLKNYIKDISFESPNAPLIFQKVEQAAVKGKPLVPELQINCNARQVAEDVFEYTLSLEATAKLDEELVYLIEIQQTALFRIVGHSEKELSEIDFRDRCPKELFPFAREAISSLVIKGGFGPELLGSINFAALFNERQVGVDKQAQAMVKKHLSNA